jgi:hypothetical protein
MNIEADSAGFNEKVATAVLKRVGTVLIVVGLIDIAYMVYFFSTGGSSYSSSFNIIAVAAGFFIRRGELRTVQFAGFFVRFGFVGIVLAVFMTPLIYPAELIRTFLTVTPAIKLIGWSAFIVVMVALLWWLDKNLQSEEVRALLSDKKLDTRWPKLVPSLKWFSAFCVGLAALMIVLFNYVSQTDTAQTAVAKAREQFGAEYSYHVSALSVSSTSQRRAVYATVIAYSDSEIKTTRVSWED